MPYFNVLIENKMDSDYAKIVCTLELDKGVRVFSKGISQRFNF